MLMKCGALVASLEAEVARAGYSVVSWQAMKSDVASLDRARSLEVVVLFEVNQLSQEVRTAGQAGISNMRFASHAGRNEWSKPIAVSQEDAELPLNACGVCGPPPVEACNGRDDDCDGSTDEADAEPCGAGVRAHRAGGARDGGPPPSSASLPGMRRSTG